MGSGGAKLSFNLGFTLNFMNVEFIHYSCLLDCLPVTWSYAGNLLLQNTFYLNTCEKYFIVVLFKTGDQKWLSFVCAGGLYKSGTGIFESGIGHRAC